MKSGFEGNPVYRQLNDRLRNALAAEYRRGDRFLTERDVAERYGVSRTTANKALAALVSEGVLEFRRGVGTFVRNDAIDYDVRTLVSFTEKAEAAGKKPSTNVLRFERVSAGDVAPEAASALRAEAGDVLWSMERLRLADGVPVILERRLVAAACCPKLTERQAKGSLYRVWTETHGLRIAGADEVIRAVALSRRDAELLGASARSPALEVTAVGYLEDETPLWTERTLYRGDQYEFHSRLGPIRSATPARGRLRSHEELAS